MLEFLAVFTFSGHTYGGTHLWSITGPVCIHNIQGHFLNGRRLDRIAETIEVMRGHGPLGRGSRQFGGAQVQQRPSYSGHRASLVFFILAYNPPILTRITAQLEVQVLVCEAGPQPLLARLLLIAQAQVQSECCPVKAAPFNSLKPCR